MAIPNGGEGVRKGDLLHIVVENVKCTVILENSLASSYKIKYATTI